MKAFIDKVFKMKKLKKDKIQEKATEAMVEAIVEEVKEVIKKEEVKKEGEEVKYPKPNHFPDCTCFKCYKWKSQNAK